jgi:transcription factor TFIIIB component B''
MYGLSYDRRHGKTSEMEKQMSQIDWHEVARNNYDAMEAAAAAAATADTTQPQQPTDIRETTEGPSGTAERPADEAEADKTPTPIEGGPGFRVIDGQIVTDESELLIDRQAQAEEEAAEVNVPIVEDNDLTKRINTQTWVNARRRDPMERIPHYRVKGDAWSEEDTERFYTALAMFGTDFMCITEMFPSRTRKMIKMKFIREERLDLQRVNAALRGEQTGQRWDLDFYARETGRDVSEFQKYESAEHADRVIRESMKEKEAQMQEAIREEAVAEEAAKQAQVARERNKRKNAERKAERERVEGGEVSKGKGGRKKKVAAASAGAGVEGDVVGGAEEA